ncbi:aldo/keto reductase [Janthinobacterium sp. MDT1-19]|uniref:aldo/keto reductase n=1 Tax=Janthinobacterium sp. MDT1-19 TaxID=1259339 RepID=UPI003F1E791E
MRYKQLGNTGLFVSELCLGTMTFGPSGQEGLYHDIAGMDQLTADRIVEQSLAAGINFFDTADVYTHGQSERMLGQALKNLGVARKDIVIATKVFNPSGTGPNDRGASRGHIMDSVSASLERLQTDYIDLYQVHANDPLTPIEETLRAFDDLISRGLVRYIGVSNWSAWRIAKANGIARRHGYARFETVQAYYSIAGRDIEREVVPMLTEEKMGLLVWSPLAGGLLSGKFGPDSSSEGRRAAFDFPPVDRNKAWECVDAMRHVAEKHSTSVASVALAYVLAKPFLTSVIIGAKHLDQLAQNLGAVKLQLDADDLGLLDTVSELTPEYPGWMLARTAHTRMPSGSQIMPGGPSPTVNAKEAAIDL